METKYIHITAAKGPIECQLAAAKVLSKFLDEMRNSGILPNVLHREKGTENGAILSAIIELKGIGLQLVLQSWIGTILWVEKSVYRPGSSRKNWYLGLFEVMNPPIVGISESEFTFQTTRSSGAGGQHINKVNSAVRAIHNETGISVLVQDSRSQHQNKAIAIERLTEKLQLHFKKDFQTVDLQSWNQHQLLIRGAPIKVFHGGIQKEKKIKKSFKSRRSELKNALNNELKS